MKAIRTIAVGVGLLLAVPATAGAQEAEVEGAGYRVGESTVIHPIVGLEGGYISNVFFTEKDGDPVGAGILRVIAELAIASLPPERMGVDTQPDRTSHVGGLDGDPGVARGEYDRKLEFRLGLRLAYEEYLSDKQTVKDQRNLAGGAYADVTVLPEGNVRFLAKEGFTRHTRPVNFESSESLDRDINDLSLGLGFFPRGRTLDGTLSYENTIDNFESETASFADRLQHRIRLRVNWRYLPVTRFYFDASQGFYGQLGDTQVGGQPYKSDSHPLRLELGAASALTEKTTLRLHAGFAAGFYSEGASYTSAVYGAEFGVRYSPLGRIIFAFKRNFEDSINANFYSDYAFRAGVQHQVSRILVDVRGELILRKYEGIPDQISTVEDTRSDTIVRAKAELGYFHKEWLAVKAGYTATSVDTDFRTQIPGAPDDPSYVRHEVGVSVKAAF